MGDCDHNQIRVRSGLKGVLQARENYNATTFDFLHEQVGLETTHTQSCTLSLRSFSLPLQALAAGSSTGRVAMRIRDAEGQAYGGVATKLHATDKCAAYI